MKNLFNDSPCVCAICVVCVCMMCYLLGCTEESKKRMSQPGASPTYMRISVDKMEAFSTESYVTDRPPVFVSEFKDVGKDQNGDWIWEENKNVQIYNKNTEKNITIPIKVGDSVNITIIR